MAADNEEDLAEDSEEASAEARTLSMISAVIAMHFKKMIKIKIKIRPTISTKETVRVLAEALAEETEAATDGAIHSKAIFNKTNSAQDPADSTMAAEISTMDTKVCIQINSRIDRSSTGTIIRFQIRIQPLKKFETTSAKSCTKTTE